MNSDLPESDIIKSQFDRLTLAVIDTSSLISIQTSGFLDLLFSNLKLISVLEVMSEYGEILANLEIHYDCSQTSLSTDQKIILLGRDLSIPVISEDKEILMATRENGLEYYNAAMMLEFLFYKKVIEPVFYETCKKNLLNCSWYSDTIWRYVAQLHNDL